ncbi:MAG: response regulator transcription factor [Chloroflexi bacterium OHK40]
MDHHPQPKPIGVVIADDHEIVRRGLRTTIAGEPDLQMLGEARTGRETLEIVARVRADVLLLDIQMPDMDGIAAATALRAAHPHLAILMLTSYFDDASIYGALRAGANGYLLKEVSGDELVTAIRGAARGLPQLHPAVAQRLMERVAPPTDPLDALTPRERDVLRQLAQGMSNKEIGIRLGMTEYTVKAHVREVLSKLAVADRTQAALLAVRYGLVHLNDIGS